MDAGIGIGGLSINKDEITSSKYDLYAPIYIDKSVRKSHNLSIYPNSSTDSKGPFVFEIPADPGKFTDLETLRLHGRMRIRKQTTSGEANLAKDEKVSTVNNIFDSLWSSVKVEVNSTEITDPSSSWYAYKAYLEKLLSYSKATKENVLNSKGFIQDKADKYDDVGSESEDSGNDGFNTRKEMFEDSKWVYFCSNLHIDLTTIRRVLPPNIKLTLTFQRNSDEFCLLAPKQNRYFIELKDLKITLNKNELSHDIENNYLTSLKKGKFPLLPMDRSLLKTFTKTPGTSDLTIYNAFSTNQLPEQIFVVIVDEKAHAGDIALNPYHFKVNNLKEASLIVNGVHEPSELYKLDIDTGDKVDLYTSFLENTGVSTTEDRDFGVSINDYYNGSFILAWDRTPDRCNRFHVHEMGSGQININLKTKSPITTTVRVIVYATYSSYLQIEEDKIITPNF